MVLRITKKISNKKTRSVIELMLNPASTLCELRSPMPYFAGDSNTSMKEMVVASMFCTTLVTRATNVL